jgi:hypothetical protein
VVARSRQIRPYLVMPREAWSSLGSQPPLCCCCVVVVVVVVVVVERYIIRFEVPLGLVFYSVPVMMIVR